MAYMSVDSIRFAPPLVISEEDLDRAIMVIEKSLNDLDKVCYGLLLML